ncbi:ATP-binding protein [Bacteroidota bacterium]
MNETRRKTNKTSNNFSFKNKNSIDITKISIVAQNTQNAVLLADSKGNVEWINQGFIDLFGYTLEEWVSEFGINFNENRSNIILKEKIAKAIINKYSITYESLNKTKNNGEIWTQTTLTPILNEYGDVTNILLIDTNIDQLKKFDEEIINKKTKLDNKEKKLSIQSRRLKKLKDELSIQKEELKRLNETKVKLLRIIGHDLRSPFTSLIGFSDLLVQNFHKLDKEKVFEYLKYINDVSKETFNLVETLIKWAKEQGKEIQYNPGVYKVTNFINNNIGLYKQIAASKNINIKVNIEEDAKVFIDLAMINTVVRNILNNAIKFTPDHGEIKIYCANYDNFKEIYIQDNGIGISEDKISNILKSKGILINDHIVSTQKSGLGLKVCKEFIQKHGGKLSIKSEPGDGTIVKFTIPTA